MKPIIQILFCVFLICPSFAEPFKIKEDARIVLIGNGLGARMIHYDHFEAGLHQRFPKHRLFVRNMCDEGNTPGFRPHSARGNPWAFPGAEKLRTLEATKDRWGSGNIGTGSYKSPDEWLKTLRPDLVVAFFGYGESFDGVRGLSAFRAELEGFVQHTLSTAYNGENAPALALVSPIAFQDLSAIHDTPNGVDENINLALYAGVMEEVAASYKVHFVDLFTPTQKWFSSSDKPLTRDGALLTEKGYAKLAPVLLDGLFGMLTPAVIPHLSILRKSIAEKNWLWLNYYKIPNGVHVFGRRHNPYGPKNYPAELRKLAQMMAVRDQAIWASLSGNSFDLAAGDAATDALPDMGVNKAKYLPVDDAVKAIVVPEGYKIELFASEREFPFLANPVQLSFDNRGRLWVSTMPSYPHYRPGDPKPDDKLLILEDTNSDGKADKQTVFADGLHLPMGFEFGSHGVYVAQGHSLVHLRDTNGDGRADSREIVLSGFDDHDTHHAISAFCADPSGAIIMGEGTFLHTNVETAYGTVRSSNGGFFRYNPVRRHLERTVRLSIPNPWGIAFDEWGQDFFADTSGPDMRWMLPGSVRVGYGRFAPTPKNLLSVRVRPTSGLEFVSSRHFPDEVQGDILINNTIGFQGMKQHTLEDDGTGFNSTFRHDLARGSDRNFRPVDMEFAPDGSLYLVDWHNALIGHMQHNARDPSRDHTHGRIYRITYPSRPLVPIAEVAGASLSSLLENLKLPEYRTRYRTRRELRGRETGSVLKALGNWIAKLEKADPRYEHHLLEALWVGWGLNQVDEGLLRKLLVASDYRARSAAVRVLRYSGHQVKDQTSLLIQAAEDKNGRVRMEAVAAASWLGKKDGLAVLEAAKPQQNKKNKLVKTGVGRLDKKGILHFTDPSLKSTRVDTITIFIPGSNQTLNLSEVEVISGGENIADQAKASQSSRYNDDFLVALLTDGDLANFAHSAQGDNNPWFQFQFSQAIKVEDVRIFNRRGYEGRFRSGQVTFARGDDVILSMGVSQNGHVVEEGMDPWISPVFKTATAYLQGQVIEADSAPVYTTHLKGADKKIFLKGAEVYNREGHCITCHQPDGKGLPAAQFPPIAESKWITGSEERLIKLTLHGLMGPLKVKGVQYPGVVPMTPFKFLPDDEVAAVLTFVRNTFGNKASVVTPKAVRVVREKTLGRNAFYQPQQLLKEHSH